MNVPVYVYAVKSSLPSDFKGSHLPRCLLRLALFIIILPHRIYTGFVEGDGAISIEAVHSTRRTDVAGVSWRDLPGYGRTLSAVTPWPRLGNNEANFTAGAGPTLYGSNSLSPIILPKSPLSPSPFAINKT